MTLLLSLPLSADAPTHTAVGMRLGSDMPNFSLGLFVRGRVLSPRFGGMPGFNVLRLLSIGDFLSSRPWLPRSALLYRALLIGIFW